MRLRPEELDLISTEDLIAAIREQGPLFALESFCFDKQLAFIHDKSQFKTAVCSRRAGKTIACAADLISTALSEPNRVGLYITLSRVNGKRIIWPELLKINREYSLGAKANQTDLSLEFPNGSVVYVSGAKDKSEVDNFRGLPIKKAYVDECQSFRPYIEELIDDVLSKALFDYSGTLCLIGTPGVIPAGYFHSCAHSLKTWSHHSWTMFENPYLEKTSGRTVLDLVQADCDRMGVGIDHPKIQRECFGRWVMDPDSLVFKYDESLNHFNDLPHCVKPWRYIVGVDIGFEDADAIAVIAYNESLPHGYLIEEKLNRKQGITELAQSLSDIVSRYNPDRMVMDTGGLGKKIAEEMRKRFTLPIVAAEKVRKFEFIELLNDALRTGRFFAKKDSAFAQDSRLVEWERDKLTPDRLVISDSYHSDITDAVLYAFRESLHWLHVPEMPKPQPHTEAWFNQTARQIEQDLIDNLNRKQETDIWGDFEWSE